MERGARVRSCEGATIAVLLIGGVLTSCGVNATLVFDVELLDVR